MARPGRSPMRYNVARMSKICGEMGVAPASSTEGGRTIYRRFRVGDTEFAKLIAANVHLARDIDANVAMGDRVCIWVYGHLSHRKSMIGLRKEGGGFYRMPGNGLFMGLIWYGVVSPVFVSIAGMLVGGLVGMVGGQRGTALGVMLGLFYGVGISWFTAYRFYTAYREMQAG